MDEKTKELQDAIASLPEEEQAYVVWAVNHYDDIARMCRAKRLTQEARAGLQRKAEEEDDPMLRVLAAFERTMKDEKKTDR